MFWYNYVVCCDMLWQVSNDYYTCYNQSLYIFQDKLNKKKYTKKIYQTRCGTGCSTLSFVIYSVSHWLILCGNIFKTLYLLNRKNERADIMPQDIPCCVSHDTCHMSPTTCRLSGVTCLVSHVRCHMSPLTPKS